MSINSLPVLLSDNICILLQGSIFCREDFHLIMVVPSNRKYLRRKEDLVLSLRYFEYFRTEHQTAKMV